MEPHRVPFVYNYHRSSMRTQSSHIVTTVLVAICEGRVPMIFFLVVQGYAPLKNNDIDVHLHTLHFQSFRTRVISYPSHFIPYSYLALMDVDQRSFIDVDLSVVRLSVRPFVCLSNCLYVNMFVDGPECFRYLHNLTLMGTF